MAREFISSTNFAPLVEIFIWLGLTTSILTVFVRIGIKWKVIRKIGYDDYLIVSSLLFATGQSIAISTATANGLGTSISSLSEAEIAIQLKASYAAEFLFVASGCLAKLSLVAFLRALTPVAFHRRLGVGLGVITMLWAVTSMFSNAFQCKLPEPWDYLNDMCFDRIVWENYVGIVNVLTNIGLTILPIMIVMSLKIAANKKIAVLLAFCSRLLCATVVAAGICQVAFLNAKMSASSDPSLDIWPVAICTQLLENLSIVTACTVYLKPFLDSLESGFIQVGDLRRQNAEGYGYTHNKNSEILSSIRGKVSNQASLPQAYRLQDRRDIMGGNTFTHAHAFASAGDQMEPGDWDANSRSQILQTRTWTVQGSDLEDGMGVAQN